MSPGFWFSVIHVMGKIGVWKPYLIFVEKFLNFMGEHMDEPDG